MSIAYGVPGTPRRLVKEVILLYLGRSAPMVRINTTSKGAAQMPKRANNRIKKTYPGFIFPVLLLAYFRGPALSIRDI